MTNIHFYITSCIIIITILLWASAILPEYITTLIFFSLSMLFSIAPATSIFKGFTSQAFWIVLSGFVLGTAIRKVGLAQRWANLLIVPFSQSWLCMVTGTVMLSYILAFIMPSNMGRIALLMPVIMTLSERAGIKSGSRGSIGLALAVGFGTFQLSSSILPANVPNLILSSAVENTWQLHLKWMQWWLLQMPILGIAKGILLIICIICLFRAEPIAIFNKDTSSSISYNEWRLIILLIIILLFWSTDGLHGVPAAWIGLAAACICLLPKIGFLSTHDFMHNVDFCTCLYVAGILGITTLLTDSGLGITVSNVLIKLVPIKPHEPFFNFISLNILVFLLDLMFTANAVPAIITPMASKLAYSSDFSLITIIMLQVFIYATPLLPYQASPIIVAMKLGNVPAKDGLQLCLLIFILSILILLPINYLWFHILGYI
ncbi:SLC13 family permease [Pantoea sp. Mhis]|uniref:SLC13 family permease n=1 Tax=Pantoea sp. Mhis TaxID=2576759 RepID=UPI00135A0C3F|nr:SLC13 family permease [Pantoea sp. Mhis]MXP56775.1 citrate transporter [Pantoea sp. Mhis]